MSLESSLREIRAAGRKILAPFLVYGYKTDPYETASAFVEAGADLVEFGIPYTDPVMDGPTIATASSVALATFPGLPKVLSSPVASPSVLMLYANQVLAYGIEKFANDAAAQGYGGVIVADLPAVEASVFTESFGSQHFARVLLASPTTTPEHLKTIAETGSGFVYCVSTLGVTGERDEVSGRARELVAKLRDVTDRPVLVGVGISTPDQAAEVCEFADGVIVGSALVNAITSGGIPEAASLVRALRTAIDNR